MSQSGVIRLVLVAVTVLVGTGIMCLTRRKGWAEIRALCISFPIAFAAVFALNWARIDSIGGLWDVLVGAVLNTVLLWCLIMVAYIGLRSRRA